MNVLQRIRIGVYLVSQAQRAWGTDRFWDVIGWWHGEVHYTILQIEEEKRVALAMKQTFIDTGEWVIDTIGSPHQYVRPNISTDDTSLNVYVPGQVGYWDWNGIKIGSNKKPNSLRQALVGFLLEAKWFDEVEKSRAKPGPEYLRLEKFLDS